MKVTVIYHADCMDGYGAACAHFVQTKLPKENVTYVSSTYPFLEKINTETVPSLKDADAVMFLDICPKADILDYLTKELGVKVVVLDHHKTALDILLTYNNENDKVIWCVATNYSGATLTHFAGPNVDTLHEVPTYSNKNFGDFTGNFNIPEYIFRRVNPNNKLYNLLEVRDLWKLDNYERKYQADCLAAAFRFNEVAKGNVCDLPALIDTMGGLDSLIATGASIKMVNDVHCDKLIAGGRTGMIGDVEYLIVPVMSDFASNVGDRFCKTCGNNPAIAILVYFDVKTNKVGLSFRSKGKHPLARLLAEEFLGGGHDHAAGASKTSLHLLPFNAIGDRIRDRLEAIINEM